MDFLFTKQRWKPLRLFFDLVLSLIIIGIGIFDFDLYFYVWIYVFLNITIATVVALGTFFFTIPIFREKNSDRIYTHFDRLCIYVTIGIGLTIVLFNIIGLITIPKDFHPVYILNIERTIRLLMFVIYCCVAEYLISIFSSRVSSHLKKLKRNMDPKDDFQISTSFETDKQLTVIARADKVMLFMSCYFEALSISGVIYFICSFLLSPYINPSMPLPFVK